MNNTLRVFLMTAIVAGVLAPLLWFAAGSEERVPKDQQGSAVEAGQANSNRGSTIGELASRCARSVGEDGFGEVAIKRRLTISNQRGEIPVPCRVRLERDGWLTLNNVELESSHLSISDYEPNGETRVRFNNSELTASGGHGFLLQLSDAEDSVAIRNSTLDYPLSVWVRVSDRAEESFGGGRIEVLNSEVRAADPESEDGIQFVAGEVGGEARFLNLELDTNDPRSGYQNALLFADECVARQVEGLPDQCGPEAMLGGLDSTP